MTLTYNLIIGRRIKMGKVINKGFVPDTAIDDLNRSKILSGAHLNPLFVKHLKKRKGSDTTGRQAQSKRSNNTKNN